jgi:hypothetical protein
MVVRVIVRVRMTKLRRRLIRMAEMPFARWWRVTEMRIVHTIMTVRLGNRLIGIVSSHRSNRLSWHIPIRLMTVDMLHRCRTWSTKLLLLGVILTSAILRPGWWVAILSLEHGLLVVVHVGGVIRVVWVLLLLLRRRQLLVTGVVEGHGWTIAIRHRVIGRLGRYRAILTGERVMRVGRRDDRVLAIDRTVSLGRHVLWLGRVEV